MTRGPCAKRRVTCTIDARSGEQFHGENDCANPQPVCPRAPGEGYEKCASICQQAAHAEVEALRAAGPLALGAIARVQGHYYICEPCGRALAQAGVRYVIVMLDGPVALMLFGSVCSGIEAVSVATDPLGWRCVYTSEIEAFPSAVLAHRYPAVTNRGDLNAFRDWPRTAYDVLVGGTPCQSFSVAGLRAGMADPRGNLALTYLALADLDRPRWVLWENVPGVLSSGNGGDFGAFLGGLALLGYGWAYRVLDAQYFGLAQRRRRVFVVGCLRGWAAAAAVTF